MRTILILATILLLRAPAAAQQSVIEGPAIAIDGDTVRVYNMPGGGFTRVRLWGVDAPEITVPGGIEARAELERIIGARNLSCHPQDRDRFGRDVARCYVAGIGEQIELNDAIIRSGWATEYRLFSSGAYFNAEAEAREARRGRWARAATATSSANTRSLVVELAPWGTIVIALFTAVFGPRINAYFAERQEAARRALEREKTWTIAVFDMVRLLQAAQTVHAVVLDTRPHIQAHGMSPDAAERLLAQLEMPLTIESRIDDLVRLGATVAFACTQISPIVRAIVRDIRDLGIGRPLTDAEINRMLTSAEVIILNVLTVLLAGAEAGVKDLQPIAMALELLDANPRLCGRLQELGPAAMTGLRHVAGRIKRHAE